MGSLRPVSESDIVTDPCLDSVAQRAANGARIEHIDGRAKGERPLADRASRRQATGRVGGLPKGVAPPWHVRSFHCPWASSGARNDRIPSQQIHGRGASARRGSRASAGATAVLTPLAPHATPGSDPNWL
jgi:hypothetical protein